MKTFFSKIINENPVLVLSLGLCPVLAVTTTLENALVMGISVTLVLILSNFIVSIFSKFIDSRIRIPAYIIIIAGLVTAIELLMAAYLPTMHKILGIYVPLIVVNCIILGRAESFASKNKPLSSIIDGFAIGIGFAFAISLISIVREVLGTGSLTIIDNTSSIIGYKMTYELFSVPISFFVSPAGAFLTMGLIIAFINKLKNKSEVTE